LAEEYNLKAIFIWLRQFHKRSILSKVTGVIKSIGNAIAGTINLAHIKGDIGNQDNGKNVQEWIEEEIEQPIEKWVETTEEKCKDYGWYDPRGWVCWIVTTSVKVVNWVIVTVGKWVTRVVCEIVHYIIHIIGIIIGFLDLLANIFLGIPELVLCLLGIEVGRRNISVCVAVIAKRDETPAVPISDIERHFEVAKKIYDRCGVDLEFGTPRVLKDRTDLLNFTGGYFRPKLHDYQSIAMKCWRFSNGIVPLPKLSSACH